MEVKNRNLFRRINRKCPRNKESVDFLELAITFSVSSGVAKAFAKLIKIDEGHLDLLEYAKVGGVILSVLIVYFNGDNKKIRNYIMKRNLIIKLLLN